MVLIKKEATDYDSKNIFKYNINGLVVCFTLKFSSKSLNERKDLSFLQNSIRPLVYIILRAQNTSWCEACLFYASIYLLCGII